MEKIETVVEEKEEKKLAKVTKKSKILYRLGCLVRQTGLTEKSVWPVLRRLTERHECEFA